MSGALDSVANGRSTVLFAGSAIDLVMDRLTSLDRMAALPPAASIVVVGELTTQQAATCRDRVLNGDAPVLFVAGTYATLPDPIRWLCRSGAITSREWVVTSAAEASRVVADLLGARPDGACVESLLRASGGRIELLSVLATRGLADGSFVRENGRLRRCAPIVVPSRIRTAIAAFRQSLGAKERAVVDVLALTQRLNATVALAFGEANVYEELEHRLLIETGGSGARTWVGLRHGVLRWVVAELVDNPTRHQLVAALEPYGEVDPIAVARVRYAAGLETEGSVLSRIARNTLSIDADDSERFARAAIAAGYDRARLTLAEALTAQGRRRDALDAIEEFAASGPDSGDWVLACVQMLALLTWDAGATRPLAESMVREAGDDGVRGALAPVANGTIAVIEGRMREAATLLAPGVLPDAPIALGFASAATAAELLGDPERALDIARRGLARAARRRGVDPEQAACAGSAAFALVALGEAAAAHQLASDWHERAHATAGIETMARIQWPLARVLLARGAFSDAAELSAEAAEMFHDLDRGAHRGFALSVLAAAAAAVGRTDRAAIAIDELDRIDLDAVQVRAGERWQARAWVAAASGRWETAAELLERAVDVSEHEQPAVAMHALFDLARFGWSEVARRRVEQIRPTSGWLAEQQRAFVLAVSPEARAKVRSGFIDRGVAGLLALER